MQIKVYCQQFCKDIYRTNSLINAADRTRALKEVLAVRPQVATGQNFWAMKKNAEQKGWEFTVLTLMMTH